MALAFRMMVSLLLVATGSASAAPPTAGPQYDIHALISRLTPERAPARLAGRMTIDGKEATGHAEVLELRRSTETLDGREVTRWGYVLRMAFEGYPAIDSEVHEYFDQDGRAVGTFGQAKQGIGYWAPVTRAHPLPREARAGASGPLDQGETFEIVDAPHYRDRQGSPGSGRRDGIEPRRPILTHRRAWSLPAPGDGVQRLRVAREDRDMDGKPGPQSVYEYTINDDGGLDLVSIHLSDDRVPGYEMRFVRVAEVADGPAE